MTKGAAESDLISGNKIDKVRASRDGHAYHETWAARSALELLPPTTNLQAIALEGFSNEDEDGLSEAATEIADLVRYYGSASIERAERAEITQFKYSIRKAEVAIRAADLAKTLGKFLRTDLDLRTKHGKQTVEAVVHYEFATNRPIHTNLIAAIDAVVAGETKDGDVETQAEQLRDVAKNADGDLSSLLKRLKLSGNLGTLKEADQNVRGLLASWSEASDPDSRKRLLQLRNLVRNKAGFEGQNNNIIDRVAVLAELEVDHESQLYPTPDAFPPVAKVIARSITDDIIRTADTQKLPIVVHASGGVGKTVLMRAIGERMSARDHVVMFDGFGAGKWRDSADGRHRPERTLVHLANLLAGQGACDILLPIYEITSLMRAFRRRLEQSVATVRQGSQNARVVLVLDAIDHAGMQAEADGTQSFAHLLLESLAVTPIDGVTAIASCRTERLPQAVRNAAHFPIEIPPFSDNEARALILARDPTAQEAELAALQGRSGNNPRVLDALLVAGRPYDGPRPGGEDATPDKILDALLAARIDNARQSAREKGMSDAGIDLLLSGLALLPPPVPTIELAAAHALPASEVESFAADLAPLLERTPHGLMFRDEPTETFIRNAVANMRDERELLVARLFERQSQTDYAARALPVVLTFLHRTDELVALAFDMRVPPGTSKVGERDIRLSRLVSALQACAATSRKDDLFRLLLEASLVAAGHERSDRFLYEHPDLAAVVGDAEALRRLFATKAGWPGGRHSALSLANMFSGDLGEARRNAQRAIDWINWAAKGNGRREFENHGASTEWDDIGFAYTELIAGNESRVSMWFARRHEAGAYRKFADLLDLSERQAAQPGVAFTPKSRLDERLLHCRLKSRALYLAALTYSSGQAARDRALVTRLVACPPPEKDEKVPGSALLSGIARAISLGMKAEARTLLRTYVGGTSVYDFSHPSPEKAPERTIVAAGLRVALRRHSASLADVAPSEFLKMVPESIRKRGPKAFDEALRKRLAEPQARFKTSPVRPVRVASRRKPTLGYEERSRYENALNHRIKPLVAYADLIAKMVAPPVATSSVEVLDEALSHLEADVAAASNYPYRDGKSYLARTGALAIFQVADAIGAFDRQRADRFIASVMRHQGLYIPELTWMVGRFSRSAELHDAALALAAHTEALVQSDTDTGTKIASYGKLARAVWRVSTDEAAVYFRRALDLAEAVGSDEFDRINHLLQLTGHYGGSQLDPEAAHSLARIFELNTHEPSKFPWNEYADSIGPAAGLSSLAIISRLDDRDHATLSQTLSAMLAVMVDREQLPAELAVAIMGLGPLGERWSWRLDNFAAKILPHLSPERHEWFLERLLVEMDRTDRLSPWRETLDGLRNLAGATLAASSPSLARLEALRERLGERSTSPTPDNLSSAESHLAGYDTADPDEIDRAIHAGMDNEAERPVPNHAIRQLATSITTPAARLSFVRAVANSGAATLSQKLWGLEDHLAEWSAKSPALREELPEIGLILAGRHANELIGRSWETNHGWRELLGTFRSDRVALAGRIIASLGSTAIEVGGDSWLSLAAHLAPLVESDAFREGLNHYLRLAGAAIPNEVGDGPWSEQFLVGGDAADATAALIWVRLGNYRANNRWRAAHAVRLLARAGRFDVLDRIVAHFHSEPPRAFLSTTLPFYILHSQLWLLIGLARVALDFPSESLRYREFLESVAFDQRFPHVAMRAYAADALREVMRALPPKEAAALATRLEVVNASPFPIEEGKAQHTHRYAKRPDDKPEPPSDFHLEYDFNKYEVAEVAAVFDRPDWEIADRITKWVRQWDANVHGMYECPRVSGDLQEGNWSGASPPDVDRYGGYLGWHALLLTAGELIATLPIRKHGWREDPWGEFAREFSLSRPDRLWLADATDLYPLDAPAELPMPENDTPGISLEDRRWLGPIIGLTESGSVGDRLTVYGNMEAGKDVSLNIRSILADPRDAETVMLAALTDRKFSQWIPGDPQDIEREFWREEGVDHGLIAWLEPNEERWHRLDRYDPYASPTAARRVEPTSWLIEHGGLVAADPIVNTWTHQGRDVLFTTNWGTKGGRGQHAWEESGERAVISREFLLDLLRRNRKALIVFAKARKFFSDHSKLHLEGPDPFSHRIMTFSLDASGRLRTVQRISAKTRAAVSSLDDNARHDFADRFLAIREARSHL